MAFTPIETQEQLNALIEERITRAKESARKEFEGFLSPDQQKKAEEELQTKLEGLTKQLEEANKKSEESQNLIKEKDEKIAKYETDSAKNRIANEMGLSYDAISYLSGSTEEEIKKSAEGLKAIIGALGKPPLADPEGDPGKDGAKAAYRKMLKDMKGE